VRLVALCLAFALGLAAAPWRGAPILDAVLNEAVEDGTIPGGVLLVGQGDRILHHRAYGNRSLLPEKAPAQLDTIYDCASLTKVVVTAPAVMMLVEQGKVRLDDRVSKYLPLFRKGDSSITVRQLLTHYSGLRPDVDLEPEWSGYETGIAKAYREVPVAQPDEKFIYSDINFILLAELVREITGERIDEFAQERIFGPLGMRDAQFNPPPTLGARIAPTERLPDGTLLHGVVHDPTTRFMGGVAGHAGMFATAADLSRYVRMLLHHGTLDGERVLSPLGVAAMIRPQTPKGKPERGIGWDIDSPYASPRGDLYDKNSFGHTGYTGTSIWVHPPTESYVILMTNRVHPSVRTSVVSLRSRVASAAAAAIAMPASAAPPPAQQRARVLTGLDVLVAENFARLDGKRVGLVANHTGIDRNRRPIVELFAEAPNVQLAAIFAPEHGFAGKLDQERIDDGVERSSGAKIYSLYQGSRRRPTPEMLTGLDALVFDIQDIGARFYTYATTLAYCLEEAAKVGLPVYVLDRPNPITGVRYGGPVLDAELKSFIGYLPGMPVQHGMTIGELALLFNQENRIGADVRVVKLEGWRREMWFDQTGLPWINPSPNIRSLTQALLYPGIALLEGLSNYSVGRGTDAPFQFVGAEWMEAAELAAEMQRVAPEVIRPYAVTRTPSESKLAGKEIHGLWLEPTDRESFEPLRFGLELASAIARRYGNRIEWSQTARLVGDQETLEDWKRGTSVELIAERWEIEGRPFASKRASVLLY